MTALQTIDPTSPDAADLRKAAGVLQSNFAASVAPTVNDDTSQGYAVGSVWHQPSSGLYWVCAAASLGAAVWAPQGPRLPPPVGGLIPAVNVIDRTATILANDTTRTYLPVAFDAKRQAVNVAVPVSVVGGANARLKAAIYGMNSDGKPGAPLLQTGEIPLTAVGLNKLSAAFSWSNARTGIYWLGQHPTGDGTTRATVIRPGGQMVPGFIHWTEADLAAYNNQYASLPRYYAQLTKPYADPWETNPAVVPQWGSECPASYIVTG